MLKKNAAQLESNCTGVCLTLGGPTCGRDIDNKPKIFPSVCNYTIYACEHNISKYL